MRVGLIRACDEPANAGDRRDGRNQNEMTTVNNIQMKNLFLFRISFFRSDANRVRAHSSSVTGTGRLRFKQLTGIDLVERIRTPPLKVFG